MKLLDSIIHGLSSFLVLCYYQCTKGNFLLLSSITIGDQNRDHKVFLNGDVTFMSKRHIKYAFPASVFLIIATIIPPVLLFSYPLCYKILALCRLQESKFTKMLCKCVPLEKYKPVFDSFQSAFKDEHRYFAGLHFMFRCFVLAQFLLHKDLINIYVILDFLFLIMLTLHASLKPYRNDRHNILDTLIFSLLIVLNTITLFNYQQRRTRSSEADIVQYTTFFQVLLAWLPLVCMLFFLSNKFMTKMKSLYASRKKKIRKDISSMILSTSLLGIEEERRGMIEMSFDKW